MGVRATVSHPLVALRMCKVSNMATRTWNHEMLQHQKYVKKTAACGCEDRILKSAARNDCGLLTVPDAVEIERFCDHS